MASLIVYTAGVDLRSVKICEVDNYITMPSSGRDYAGHSKFQCYFDYYWTSVIEVRQFFGIMLSIYVLNLFFHHFFLVIFIALPCISGSVCLLIRSKQGSTDVYKVFLQRREV